ncbi:hypothetical protein SAMN05444371_2018 [Epilithonimonas mollis]|uniref:Uncharacterized protein n=1 Tax=Epilithonimonas mollis TaxID=216903 RepID=A0A1M6RPX2_9FLAO|nr:hypothetical protein SAMN05444371_2018 [Epilithonimonas mollis]
MWKTFTDDCQIFDVFRTFALSFVGFNFYFCVIASEEKRNVYFLKNQNSEYFHKLLLTN